MSNNSGDTGGAQMSGGGSNQPTALQIDISIKDGHYFLGGPIELSTDYLNISDGPVSFREPAKTWEVQLQVKQNPEQNQDEEKLEAPFGQIFFYKRDDGFERRTIEEAKTINLQPNEKHNFVCDIGTRWPEMFVPGVNLVSVKDLTDDDFPLQSNQVQVQVVYDESTFPTLLALAGDGQTTIDARQFATTWIKKIYPEFELVVKTELSTWETEDNSKQIERAEKWWQANQNDTNILNQLKILNAAR